MALVSVIMGVYNCKDYEVLENSINSIINQSFTDWEFIICNDGSTNDTLQEIKKYEKIDNRIKVVSYKENRGLAYALNYCLKFAKGKYIARQDDDDYSELNRLKVQVEFMVNHPEYAIVGANAFVYDDDGIWGQYIVEERPEKASFFWNSPFAHPIVLIDKQALDKVNGYRIAKETRRCEDYDLFMRMYAMGCKGYNIQEKLYNYRIVNNASGKYRAFKYRIDEAKVRFLGYKKMSVLAKGFPYVFKPILIGLIPQFIFSKIRRNQY